MAESVLNPEQIKIIKSTAPVFQEHGVTITKHFYKRVLDGHPSLNNIFNNAHQQTGAQPTALAHAVFAYAANIDNLGALGKAVSNITHKHASLGIAPELYPIVGENLLASVKEVLGDAVNDEIIDTWAIAYKFLADLFIGMEKGLYDAAASAPGGWRGWRKFNVAKRVVESSEITSFYLEPVDGKPVPEYKPGQFTTIKHFVPELGYEQPRQYSLSTVANTKYLRISVKQEREQNDKPHGKVSTLLHTEIKEGAQVELAPPFGNFTLNEEEETPVVLISAGVGLTPMITMLESLTSEKTEGAGIAEPRKVVFVHGTRNKQSHAMREFVKDLVQKNSQHVESSVWYSDVSGAVQGVDYDFAGRINLAKIQKQVVLEGANYYVCGPGTFMKDVEEQLLAFGVQKDHVHSEIFGVI